MKKIILLVLSFFVVGFTAYAMPDGPAPQDSDIKTLMSKAAQGDPESQHQLAKRYQFGNGVPQSYEEAFKWYNKASEQGYSNSMNNLGVMYINGEGVPQSDVIGLNWYLKAAKLGNATAICNVGGCYANGYGVPKSDVDAVWWYRKAAAKGSEHAKQALQEYVDELPTSPQSLEYYIDEYGVLLSFSITSFGTFLTSHGGSTTSLPMTLTGRTGGGDYSYAISGVIPYMTISANRRVLTILSMSGRYLRCSVPEAELELREIAKQSYAQNNGTNNSGNSSSYNSGSASSSSQYVSVGSASATVIQDGYSGQSTSYRSNVSIYEKGGSYYIKIGASYYRLSSDSRSSYLGKSTNGANYSAMVNSSFYFVSLR